MLYFQTQPNFDGHKGQMTGTFVQGELIRSVKAAEYKNLPTRFGQCDVRISICGAEPAPFPFYK